MATVILCNPMGTDVTNFVNGTFGVPQLLRGTVMEPGDVLYTLPYVNQSGVANIEHGVQLLDAKIRSTDGTIRVFSYSEGCQIADLWLTNYGQSTPVDPDALSFLSIANANRVYGGFAYGHSVFDSVGFTGGLPAKVPYAYRDFARQYDGIADFPTDPKIQAALVGIQTVATDANALSDALSDVAAVLANTPEAHAAENAVIGMALIHNYYFPVTPDDECNSWYTDPTNGVEYGLALTYPVPVGEALRPQIESCYERPMTPKLPTPGSLTGGAATAIVLGKG